MEHFSKMGNLHNLAAQCAMYDKEKKKKKN